MLAKPADGMGGLGDEVNVVPAGVRRGLHAKNDNKPGKHPSRAETR